MQITRIEAIPIKVPLKSGLTTKTAHGEHIDSPYVIVRLHTDEGVVGLGEATLAPRWSGETSPGCVAVLHDLIAPALIGRDPTQITVARRLMERQIVGNPFTKAAVEMALWDIKGKAAGLPVCDLLGGAVKEKLPMKMVIGAFPVAKAVELAELFLGWGVKCLKVKVGLDPAEDIARFKAVREVAGPDIPIGVDGNCGWDLATAKIALTELARYDVLFAEQPVGKQDIRWLCSLREATDIPVMADESVFTLNDAWRLTAEGVVDILSIYPGKHGGIAAATEIAHVAEAAGICCSMGSNLELGIATAAMLHLGAAIPAINNEQYPGDYLGPLYHEADMITQSLDIGSEFAHVPSGPGLGVELDETQLAKYRKDV